MNILLQVVQVCISTQEPLVQRLNDVVNNTSGSEKPRLQDRCQAMNGLFNVVQVMARDEQNVLQDRLKEYKAFMGSLEELLRWMNGYRATLVSCPPLSALPDGAEQQHNEFMVRKIC